MYDVLMCRNPAAEIFESAEPGRIIGRRESWILYGERFQPFEPAQNHFIRGISLSDRYEGYVHASALAPLSEPSTHYVGVPMSGLYPQASFKARPLKTLPMMARLTVGEDSSRADGFIHIEGLGWIYEDHIVPHSAKESNLSKTALDFIGAPYLYAGRMAWGIDCSGLVQISCMRAGMPCPRDSDQQQLALGRSIDLGDSLAPENLQKNDLVFFKGHVGIMLDDTRILNATSRTMRVSIEDVKTLARLYDSGVVSVRRI